MNRDLGATEPILCDITMGTVIMCLSKLAEHLPQSMNPSVTCGLWL